MNWVIGFDVEGGGATLSSGPYRSAASASRRITIRNPPGLSILGACAGLAVLMGLATAIAFAWMSDGPGEVGLELRIFAPAIVGLAVLGAGLSALTPHTLLRIDAEQIVVERAKQSSSPRVRLLDVQRFERDAQTAGVRAMTAAGPVILASGLLPEQADLLLEALRPALSARS